MSGPHGKIVAIIEARMTSSRLPGKVLMPAAGKPLLGHLIRRLQQTPSIDDIVVATTVNAADEPLVALAREYGVGCFRGSEEDVMGRVLGAGEAAQADIVVNLTGDCPLIDPVLNEQTIRMFLANQCDYATNGHIHTFPGGYAVQVYRLETLRRSASMTNERLDREHVTLHIRNHPELFRHVILAGRRINDGMGKFIAEQTIKHMIASGSYVKGAKVNILGLTFKEDCGDLRNSKVIDIINELKSYGVDVFVTDPRADATEAMHEYGVSLLQWSDLPRADAIVAAVAHREFAAMTVEDFGRKLVKGGAFIDVKAAFDRRAIEGAGYKLWRL